MYQIFQDVIKSQIFFQNSLQRVLKYSHSWNITKAKDTGIQSENLSNEKLQFLSDEKSHKPGSTVGSTPELWKSGTLSAVNH